MASRDKAKPTKRDVLLRRARETDWLEGTIRWSRGRVVFCHRKQELQPTPGRLAKTARRLSQSANKPKLLAKEFGADWLPRRQRLLELAKKLGQLAAHPLESGDPIPESAVIPALCAEALILEPLPLSPTKLLFDTPPPERDLYNLFSRVAGIPSVLALTAMLLGALGKPFEPRDLGPTPHPEFHWFKRCYQHGRQHRLPLCPALGIRLLQSDRTAALVPELLKLLSSDEPYRLTAVEVSQLLAEQVEPKRILALCRTFADCSRIRDQLMSIRHLLDSTVKHPGLPKSLRSVRDPWERSVRLRQMRNQWSQRLEKKLRHLALSSSSPDSVRQATQLLFSFLERSEPRAREINAMVAALDRASKLETVLHQPYFELLTLRLSGKSGKRADWQKFTRCVTIPLSVLLTRYGDRELAEQLLMRRLQEVMVSANVNEANCRRLIEWWDYFGAAGTECRRTLRLTSFGEVDLEKAEAVKVLLFHKIGSGRGFNLLLDLLDEAADPEKRFETRLAVLGTYIPGVLPLLPDSDRADQDLPGLLDGLEELDRDWPERAPEFAQWLVKKLMNDEGHWTADTWSVPQAVSLALAVSDGDKELLLSALSALLHPAVLNRIHVLNRLKPAFAKSELFRELVFNVLGQEPNRVTRMMMRLVNTEHLGLSQDDLLIALRVLDPPPVDRATIDSFPLEWQPVATLDAELASLVGAWIAARKCVGHDPGPPPRVVSILQFGQRLQREANHLAQLVENSSDPKPGMVKRLKMLRLRLEDTSALDKRLLAQLQLALPGLVGTARLRAVDHILQELFRRQLERIVPTPAPDVELNDDLINAILLDRHTEENRRLLRKLIRRRVGGEHDWPRSHPENQRFLGRMAKAGYSTEAWLKPWPATYRHTALPAGQVRIHLETDPLKVLQMGNYFDTCLAVENFNNFSTIANACELNKRVIYVTDPKGGVVGRKLCGLTEEWLLIGFHCYCSYGGNAALLVRQAVYDFARRFADRCGLKLAPTGVVAKLFAERWYDDGEVPWSPLPEEKLKHKRPLSRVAESRQGL